MEVDMVYLWVNGNDPEWQRKHNAIVGHTEADSATNCDGRYADNDELKFSLRSVEKYAPWIRKIFIVTDNQVPAWLDTSNPKIQIVDHTEILPQEALPCFNSRIIEHHLFRISGLAEHFIYANDDMYINQSVTPDFFFNAEDGYPYIRFNRHLFRKLQWMWRTRVRHKPLSNYNNAIFNTALAVEQRYGKFFSGKTHHNIDAYRRSDYQAAYEEFEDYIRPTLKNHVRSLNDMQRNLYSYYPLVKKHAHLLYVDRHTSFRLHIERREHYEKLNRYSPMLFCMNDSEYATDSDRKYARRYLENRFPDKSEFEK